MNVGVLGLGVALVAAQPVSLAPEAIRGIWLELDEDMLLAVTPAQLPPSKTRLLFDSHGNNKQSSEVGHFEIVWDPTESKPLTRSVRLKKGDWQVSMVSVPIEFEREAFSNAAWTRLCVLSGGKPPRNSSFPNVISPLGQGLGSLRGPPPSPQAMAYFAVASGAGPLIDCRDQERWQGVALRFEYLKSEDAKTLLASFGNRGEASTPIGSVPRGFGVDVEKVAAEAFQAVADVAVVRAQQAALDATKAIIVKRVCAEWVGEVRRALQAHYFVGSDVLKRTCLVLENVTAAGLATLGETLKNALRADAVDLASELVSHQLGRCLGAVVSNCGDVKPIPGAAIMGPALAMLAGVVAAAVFESDAVLPRAQAFVVQMARSQRDEVDAPLKLAMSVLAYCHQAGNCDSHTIRSLLEDPTKIIEGAKPLSDAEKEQLGNLVSIVSHGLTIMAPRKGDDAKTHVLNALRFGKGAFRLLAVGDGCRGKLECQTTVRQVEDAFDMLFAAIEEQPVRLITMAGALLSRAMGLTESPAGLKVLTAVATYADAYAGSAVNATPEMQRQRRAEAIAALADVAKERDIREGEFSLAAGVWVGPRISYATNLQKGYFQLSLPMGLLARYHVGRTWGLWGGIFAVDLGDYGRVTLTTATVNPSPVAALSFGASLGMWFLSDFVAAFDWRYQPWATGAGQGTPAFSFGFSVSYALPLLWLQ